MKVVGRRRLRVRQATPSGELLAERARLLDGVERCPEPACAGARLMPDQTARDMDPAWFEDGETIRVADAVVLDLMFKACGETYESLLPYAKTIDLAGVPVVTVTLEGPLKTKQSDLEKDALDRATIERVLGGLGDNLEDGS